MTALLPGTVDPTRAELQQAVLVHLAASLNTLTSDELRALADGRGRLVFSAEPAPPATLPAATLPTATLPTATLPTALPTGPLTTGPMRAVPHRAVSRPASRSDVQADVTVDVEVIRTFSTPEEVRAYLDGRRFTLPVLRKLARALGPTVPAAGRTKGELVHGIVEGTVGFRARSQALSGGAWGRIPGQ